MDFLYAKNTAGAECAGLLSNVSLIVTLGTTYEATTDTVCTDDCSDSCSDTCSIALQKSSGDWGCCVYTFHALNTNATFDDDVYDRCKVESPGLCEGALSGALISAPDIEDVALTTAVSSAMLVATAMLLAVVINCL